MSGYKLETAIQMNRGNIITGPNYKSSMDPYVTINLLTEVEETQRVMVTFNHPEKEFHRLRKYSSYEKALKAVGKFLDQKDPLDTEILTQEQADELAELERKEQQVGGIYGIVVG